MSSYICGDCGYTTPVKYNFSRHLAKKGPCVKKVNSTINDHFTKTPDGKWECKTCSKVISSNSKRHHFTVACRNGLTALNCRHCGLLCDNRFVKARHQRGCVKNPKTPRNNNNNTAELSIKHKTPHITTFQNITNINITNNISFHFGKEDLDYLIHNRNDPRIQHAFRNLFDTIDLVHFNEDHPENHTVRKSNKKSDLIEFRTNNNRWEPESCMTGIPKLRHNLESRLNTTFAHCEPLFNQRSFKDILYYKSKRGSVSENTILCKYTGNTLADLANIDCTNECLHLTTNFKNTVSPNVQMNPSAIAYLRTQINSVREKYGFETLGMRDVAQLIIT